jgi:hypothetical protein
MVAYRRAWMRLQGDELKRRLMEEVPQEPITADPREDDEDDEDVPEEDDEHGVKLADSANNSNSGEERR